MKGIHVIAIAFLASWTVNAASFNQDLSEQDTNDGIPTECPFPQPNWRNTTTNIPHEYDCTKFYKCKLGKGIEQSCPLMTAGDPVSRLHYNRRLQVCDWPWQAGCKSCPLQYPNGTYPSPSRINNPSNDCQYRECVNGVPSPPINCLPNECFSRTCQECVEDRNNGNCDRRPTVIPPECLEGDKKDHDCSCVIYFRCNGSGNWLREECEGGLHYSPTEKICLPPNEAGCRHLPGP